MVHDLLDARWAKRVFAAAAMVMMLAGGAASQAGASEWEDEAADVEAGPAVKPAAFADANDVPRL
jgi:hypothetical protein